MQTSLYHEKKAMFYPVMRGICVICGVLVFLASLVNWFIAYAPILASLQTLYILTCAATYYLIKHEKLTFSFVLFNILFLSLLVVYGALQAQLRSGMILPTLALPAIYHVFLSLRQAAWCSFLMLVTALSIIYFQSQTDLSFLLFNFSVTYIAIWLITARYEKSRLQIHQQLSYQATHDPLTGTRNRQALRHDLNNRWQSADNLHLLLIDIDHFKQINDNYGHDAGDAALCWLVKHFNLHCGAQQQLYRLGGEEFLLISSSGDYAQAQQLAQNLRADIENSVFNYQHQQLQLRISIGMASCSSNMQFRNCLKLSDQRLYQAKQQGRNQVCAE